MFRVEVDWAPAYELLVSLQAYLNRGERKTLELGADWARRVRQQLDPQLTAELADRDALESTWTLGVLLRQCPHSREPSDFARWIDSNSSGELYERLVPFLQTDLKLTLPPDLKATISRYAAILLAWNEQYFRHVDPAILEGLRRDCETKQALIGTTPPQELVELATNGIQFTAEASVETVLLVPQYHYRPWNLLDRQPGLQIFEYSADALPASAGEPSPALLRLTRALSDENRLRILRFLAGGPCSFTEVARFIGLAKSTVHHHLVALRAAGLICIHMRSGNNGETYSLRPSAVDRLGDSLRAYLTDG